MSLQVTISGQGEAIVKAQLANGNAQSPEELVERALRVYAGYSLGRSRKTRDEAVADIHELRKEIEIGGLNVKDMAHEGHKY